MISFKKLLGKDEKFYDLLEASAEEAKVSTGLLVKILANSWFCDALDSVGCEAVVAMDRGNGKIQRDLAGHVLSHLFMHQTHHRGQAHAMLSGTSVAPPQLDEFLMPSDASWRAADMAALGWREIDVYGAPDSGCN